MSPKPPSEPEIPSDVEKYTLENPGEVAKAAMDKVNLTQKEKELYAKNRAIDLAIAAKDDLDDLAEKEAALIAKNSLLDAKIAANSNPNSPTEIPAKAPPHHAPAPMEPKQPEIKATATATAVSNEAKNTPQANMLQPSHARPSTENHQKNIQSFFKDIGKKGLMLSLLERLVDTVIKGIGKILSISPKMESSAQKKYIPSNLAPKDIINPLVSMQQKFKDTLQERKDALADKYGINRDRKEKKDTTFAIETPRPR